MKDEQLLTNFDQIKLIFHHWTFRCCLSYVKAMQFVSARHFCWQASSELVALAETRFPTKSTFSQYFSCLTLKICQYEWNNNNTLWFEFRYKIRFRARSYHQDEYQKLAFWLRKLISVYGPHFQISQKLFNKIFEKNNHSQIFILRKLWCHHYLIISSLFSNDDLTLYDFWFWLKIYCR